MQIAMDASTIYPGYRVTIINELDDIDALVAQYWPRIFRYVSFSINDADLAQTITQDCFLKAFNARTSFRGDCSVNTWLISIANNLIRDQVRLKKFQFWRKAQNTALDVTELGSFLPSGESSAESRLLARERMEQVKVAIDQLSVNQRRVFLLRFFEGMNLEEISQSTGMPVNTVKTHLLRGTSAVRAKLGGKL
ncbi:RNA polymerase sigma-70 factor, ECF subfamily [Granulicella pectinivorans]|jgi:RNA polymerase sigma-70 factor (ECF subfamily)|uniref:RNA polymerase sigma-70 factor, ECF subfamily n=1 Tax=Granulicella pectinivorans TaxID=474950 RepID=A0A1I6MB60_9BACT|nr:sigma-70 family RNA polymerase sigma factor [Granulicella pectinivorans]SFS12847.1 RNA polymerase sigma-70 factor, ECF subfamily [Granulicella pectinivorans]